VRVVAEMRTCLRQSSFTSIQRCFPARRAPVLLRTNLSRAAHPVPQQQRARHDASSAQPAMDVSTAALPAAAAYGVALAGISVGLLAAWLDAKRKSRSAVAW
jgi:hypothetical protein